LSSDIDTLGWGTTALEPFSHFAVPQRNRRCDSPILSNVLISTGDLLFEAEPVLLHRCYGETCVSPQECTFSAKSHLTSSLSLIFYSYSLFYFAAMDGTLVVPCMEIVCRMYHLIKGDF
jgi:hypothetical protein